MSFNLNFDGLKGIATSSIAFGKKNAPAIMTGGGILLFWGAGYLFWKESRKAEKAILAKEIELQIQFTGFLVGDAANEPVVTASLLTGHRHVLAYLGMRDKCLTPSRRTALDECQRRLPFIVLDGISCHLQRTEYHYELSQLLGQGTVGMRSLHHL